MMKYKRIAITTVVFIILLSFFLPAHKVYSYDLEKHVQKFTLSNGLKVLIVERHSSPTVSLYIRYKVGAVDEDNGETGSAHLLEHMHFKGTKTIGTTNFDSEQKILGTIKDVGSTLDAEKMKGESADGEKIEKLTKRLNFLQKEAKKWIVASEIDRLYTENGATNLNASTGYDMTTYHVSLPSNRIELWARIESDRMAHPVFREFYSERNVVMEERKQTTETDPGRKLMEQFLASAFIAHPYRRPVIGWTSDMQYLDMDYLDYLHRTYHAPNNTVMSVVGDVSTSETITLIKKYFGKIKPQKIPLKKMAEEPEQKGERRINVVFDASPQLIIGYHKPTLPAFDDYVCDAIDIILSDGRTSRLFTSLVKEKQIAESINTANGFPGARYPNLFVIFGTPRYPHSNEELENAIYEIIETLKREPVSEREIEKAKNSLKADFIRRLSSNSGLASMLTYYEIVAGDYRYITNFMKIIDKITSEDIMNAAKKYLNSENRTIAVLEKKES